MYSVPMIMKDFVLVITADKEQAAIIESALDHYSVLHCSDAQQAKLFCRKHAIRLVLLADDPPNINAKNLFSELQQEKAGLAGILLSPAIDRLSLNGALETGFSGMLEFPVDSNQVAGIVDRIIRQAELQAENARLKTLLPLYALGEQFISSSNEKEVLDGLLASVAALTDSHHISVLLFDAAKEYLYIAAAVGLDEDLIESIRVLPGQDIAGWVFENGKSVLLNKGEQEQTMFAPFLKRPEIVSAISCPLRIRGDILGVLNISQTQADTRFSEADMEMVSVVCTQAAMALDNVRALKRMNEMTRLRTLFEQYVSPDVAGMLLEKDSDLLQVGKVQEVTILFADIRNFTGLVQVLDLEQLREFLNGFFDIFTETVFKKQGTVDKFMGDAVLAVFGAPLANDHGTVAAVEAALLIRNKFESLRESWGIRGEVFKALDLGIGITHGRVFHGNVGSSKRLDYTVIGHEVNVAQRLAAESTRCRIFITQEVQRRLSDRFKLEKNEGVSLRGMEKELTVYTLLDEQ